LDYTHGPTLPAQPTGEFLFLSKSFFSLGVFFGDVQASITEKRPEMVTFQPIPRPNSPCDSMSKCIEELHEV
jgi:hypothetical protein